MIIKSLSRKSASYDQLLDYMSRRSIPEYTLFHNIYRTQDKQRVVHEFERMGESLPKRKNGNMLYHEILSIQRRNDVPLDMQKEALFAMVQQYLQARAPGQIGYGCMHVEKEHLHVHLMLSPNRVDRPEKRVRLKKSELWDIQSRMEMFLQERLPQLKERSLYSRKKAPALKKTERESQMELRTGQPSTKSQVRDLVNAILEQSPSEKILQQKLQAVGMRVEHRGKLPVLVTANRRYRLKTLGLQPVYERVLSQEVSHAASLEQEERPLQETQTKTRIVEVHQLQSPADAARSENAAPKQHPPTRSEWSNTEYPSRKRRDHRQGKVQDRLSEQRQDDRSSASYTHIQDAQDKEREGKWRKDRRYTSQRQQKQAYSSDQGRSDTYRRRSDDQYSSRDTRHSQGHSPQEKNQPTSRHDQSKDVRTSPWRESQGREERPASRTRHNEYQPQRQQNDTRKERSRSSRPSKELRVEHERSEYKDAERRPQHSPENERLRRIAEARRRQRDIDRDREPPGR